MCGGGGSPPPVPPAPPPPAADNAAIQETQAKTRRLERSAAGRASTILTGPTGVSAMDETTKKKTLGSSSLLGG